METPNESHESRASSREPPLPPKTEMAANLASAIVRAAKAVVTGQPVFVTVKERDLRWLVCLVGRGLPPDQTVDGHCDHYRPSDNRCGIMPEDRAKRGCGCELFSKAGLATEDCPLGRWPKREQPADR